MDPALNPADTVTAESGAPDAPDGRAREARTQFDALAERWDGMSDRTLREARLIETLPLLGIRACDRILDLGCGTGLLAMHLLRLLGPDGRILAADISPCMLSAARLRLADPRCVRLCLDAHRLPIADAGIDTVIVFSAWPHFTHPVTVARELRRVLRSGGRLHVLHTESRTVIAAAHRRRGGALADDVLPSSVDLAGLFRAHGFSVNDCDESEYLFHVSGTRLPDPPHPECRVL
jgi:ubiquinone/menaquinone biosynthesis C-methylase UbiE